MFNVLQLIPIIISIVTFLLVALIAIAGVGAKTIVAIVRGFFTKLSYIMPTILSIFLNGWQLSTAVYAVIGTILLIVLMDLNNTFKITVDICASGLFAGIVMACSKYQMGITAMPVLMLQFYGIWFVFSITNVILGRKSYEDMDREGRKKVSSVLYYLMFVICAIISYIFVGSCGFLDVEVMDHYILRVLASLFFSILYALLTVFLYKKMLNSDRLNGIDKSNDGQNSTSNQAGGARLQYEDYMLVKETLEDTRSCLETCVEHMGIFTNEEQEHIKNLQRIFYEFCNEFQQNGIWGEEQQDKFKTIVNVINKYADRIIDEANSNANSDGYSNNNEYQSNNSGTSNISEIERAMIVFMLDSLDGVTDEQLKKQRNKLLHIYHTDNGEESPVYAQKINDSYSVLKNAIQKK